MLLTSFLAHTYTLEKQDLSQNTIRSLADTIAVFSRFLKRLPHLEDLTRENVLNFMRSLAKNGNAPKTINIRRACLLAIWRLAAELGMAPIPPVFARRKLPKTEPKVLTLEELRRVYKNAEKMTGHIGGIPASTALQLMMTLKWDSGCRIGELLLAVPKDINLAAAMWRVPASHTKDCREKHYRLRTITCSILRSLDPKREHLITSIKNRKAFYTLWNNLLAKSGIGQDRTGFHLLRRSVETIAAANKGVSYAAACIGHSEEIARRHYIAGSQIPMPSLHDATPDLVIQEKK